MGLGGLIHAAVGSRAGVGARLMKRSGIVAYAAQAQRGGNGEGTLRGVIVLIYGLSHERLG